MSENIRFDHGQLNTDIYSDDLLNEIVDGFLSHSEFVDDFSELLLTNSKEVADIMMEQICKRIDKEDDSTLNDVLGKIYSLIVSKNGKSDNLRGAVVTLYLYKYIKSNYKLQKLKKECYVVLNDKKISPSIDVGCYQVSKGFCIECKISVQGILDDETESFYGIEKQAKSMNCLYFTFGSKDSLPKSYNRSKVCDCSQSMKDIRDKFEILRKL